MIFYLSFSGTTVDIFLKNYGWPLMVSPLIRTFESISEFETEI